MYQADARSAFLVGVSALQASAGTGDVQADARSAFLVGVSALQASAGTEGMYRRTPVPPF